MRGNELTMAEQILDSLEEGIVIMKSHASEPIDLDDPGALDQRSKLLYELKEAQEKREGINALIAEWRGPVRNARDELAEIDQQYCILARHLEEAQSFFQDLGDILPESTIKTVGGSVELEAEPMDTPLDQIDTDREQIPEPARSVLNEKNPEEIFGYKFGFWIAVKNLLHADNATVFELIQSGTLLKLAEQMVFDGRLRIEQYHIFEVITKTVRGLPIWKGGVINLSLLEQHLRAVFEKRSTNGKGKGGKPITFRALTKPL